MNKNQNYSNEEIAAFLKSRKKPFLATLDDVIAYWDKKDWLTQKGMPVSTLSSLVHVANSYVVEQKRKEGVIDIKDKTDKKNKSNAWSENRSPYFTQLTMPQWEAYREFIFSVRGRRCEVCGKPSCLQIHHTHYINNRFAWEYLPNEVLVVCRNCHRNIHHVEQF